MKKDWGTGIPQYLQNDVMTDGELLNFAMSIVKEYELDKNEYEVISATDDIYSIPNFIVKKDEQLIFIVVKAAIAPYTPALENGLNKKIIDHAKMHHALCYYAPVSFGSIDSARFSASLALRGDGFYANYKGLEKL